MPPAKIQERELARELRRRYALPVKEIAARLGVSQGSVSIWTRDIVLTPAQRARNIHRAGKLRGRAWREINRDRRRGYQDEGRARARQGDALHEAGCMLYWAEGAKDRNGLVLANSDVELVKFFLRFLRECLDVSNDDIRMRLNVYTNNGLPIEDIERYWLEALGLPRTCLGQHTTNHRPTSSSGRKRDKLPYGVCAIRVKRATRLVQHIYGAIQEYGGFEEPRWLDGPPIKPRPRRSQKSPSGSSQK